MTLIVASLFLPHQPQFEVNASAGDTQELVESNLVKLDQISHPASPVRPGWEHYQRNTRSALAVPMAGIGRNVSQESLLSLNNAGNTSANIDDLVSSEHFLENLTANATASGTPNPSYHTKGQMGKPNLGAGGSTEEFFSTSNPGSARGGSPVLSVASAPIGDTSHIQNNLSQALSGSPPPPPSVEGTGNDSTASLLKNVSKSLMTHKLEDVATNSRESTNSLGGSKYNHANTSIGTAVTPKSRPLPGHYHSSSIIDNRVKQMHQNTPALPAMRRVQQGSAGKSSPRLLNRGSTFNIQQPQSSRLKYSQTAQRLQNESALENDLHSATEVNTHEEEEIESVNDDSASKLEYLVPQFGGFSTTCKQRERLLKSSRDLFAQLPWKIVQSDKGNGSLKNAVNTAIMEKTTTENVKWIGTMGIPTDEVPDDIIDKIANTMEEQYHCGVVITDDITFKGAYKNYCKQILWPTLQYQIPDNPNSKAFEDHSWEFYYKLNRQFADKIIKVYKPGDTIWVHDYHLMLVPGMVRAVHQHAKIGFFLHVSFPSGEVFRCLAHREEILEGLIGANSVGFQTKEYARHFLQTSNRLLAADVSEDEIKYEGRIVSVKDIPVGIDFFNLREKMKDESVEEWRSLIKERWQGKKLIVCRDQFDRIRGLHKKMLAYERFLKENPQYIHSVVLVQVCIGKSKDLELERQIMVVVDRINAMSPNISLIQPVVFLHQELDFPQYLALNSEADLFIVSALREGMNLTCHEFIGCSSDKNAPLILSEFTGSSSVLSKGAQLVNPWDIKQVANSIKEGLEMSREEKKRNWKKMVKSVIINDSDNWFVSCLQSINSAWEFNKERSTVFNLSYENFENDYEDTSKRMFIFKISEPPSSRMISILNDLASKNIVYIINSFSKAVNENLYNRVNNIGLIAENGAYVRLNGDWYNIVEEVNWRSEVIKILDDKVERLPGSYYKIADSMIRFHTENADDQERVPSVIGDAITHINTLFDDAGIHAYLHKNIVFVQQTGLSLNAVQFLLRFYNTAANGDNVAPMINASTSENTTSDGFANAQTSVEFLCISGSSSPTLEPLFKMVKDQKTAGVLRHGHTIVYGDTTSSYAREHINGSNGLFSILQRVLK
ncbi:trehalose 6-phosphate synthase/phosphatase complex subunit [Nakaseomyces bracarensis]|uniref:trehalose 6-phosphate synthase/phosphatase complex subunit n=1 Tax=Nakaseomyces bracarensis TaxID=273131 RepID=UPI003870F910